MKISFCVFLAAFLALVSTEGDRPYCTGQLFDKTFCEAFDASRYTCENVTEAEYQRIYAKESENQTEIGNTTRRYYRLTSEQDEEILNKSLKCIEENLGDAINEYNKIKSFCESTTCEDNHQDLGEDDYSTINPRQNYIECLEINLLKGCYNGRHRYYYRRKRDSSSEAKEEELDASENLLTSMFFF